MSEETSFEDQMIRALKRNVIKELNKTPVVSVSYKDRREVPSNVLDKVWNSIDWDEVIETIKPEIHRRVCNSIIGSMETELKTDMKKVLGVEGVRQRLRMEIYPKLMAILSEETI